MKRLILVTLLIALVGTSAWAKKIYRVTNAVEFMKALGSNRTVVVAAGTTINLSDVLSNSDLFESAGLRYMDGSTSYQMANYEGSEKNMKFSVDIYDGHELMLYGMSKLTLRGEDAGSKIVVEPRYANVINFIRCDDITIDNLVIGHTEEGFCTGGVLVMNRCNQVKIDHCDLYGCGIEGINAEQVTNLQVSNTWIHDCSYDILTLALVTTATFTHCDFTHCRDFPLVNVGSMCAAISFDDCMFANNTGTLFSLNSRVVMRNCVIRHDLDNTFTDNAADFLSETDCRWFEITGDVTHRESVGPVNKK